MKVRVTSKGQVTIPKEIRDKIQMRYRRMGTNTLNKLIEDFSQLPLEDKEYAIDIIKKQLIEAKRDAIAKRAKESMTNLKKGLVKKGTVKDLYKDLEGD